MVDKIAGGKTTDKEFGTVSALIEKEKAAALQRFRESDFEGQMARRIAQEGGTGVSFMERLHRLMMQPAMAMLVVLVLVAVPAYFYFVDHSPSDAAIQKEMEQMFAAVSLGNQADYTDPLQETPEFLALSWQMEKALNRVYKRNDGISEEHLPGIFQKVLGKHYGSNGVKGANGGGEDNKMTPPNPDDLEKRIKLLIHDREVENNLNRLMNG